MADTYNGSPFPTCRRIAGDLLSFSCFCGACEPDGMYDDYEAYEEADPGYPACEVCGDPIDYCQGHGTLG